MQEADKLAIGERIRTIREKMGLSRDEFAEMMGVSTVFLRSIECGQRGMSIETLQKLCVLCNISSDHILFGTSYPVRPVWLLEGADFVRSLEITDAEKELILHGNAERLYHM